MWKCKHWQGRGAPSVQLPPQHTHTALNRMNIQIHIQASLKRRQRPVDLQRCAQVLRACSTDVVATKAAHV
jgi:hypothetical protein